MNFYLPVLLTPYVDLGMVSPLSNCLLMFHATLLISVHLRNDDNIHAAVSSEQWQRRLALTFLFSKLSHAVFLSVTPLPTTHAALPPRNMHHTGGDPRVPTVAMHHRSISSACNSCHFTEERAGGNGITIAILFVGRLFSPSLLQVKCHSFHG